MRTIFLDGQYFTVNAQIVETFTPGTFKARGVFETMLGKDGVVIDTGLHLHRLRDGLKSLGLHSPSIHPSVLKEVLHRNHLVSARIRLMVWQAGRKLHVLAAAVPYKSSGKKKYHVCLVKTDRAATDRFADVKSLDYALFAEAYARAREQGFDEALLLNRRGHIFEAARSNIFWMKDDILYTPPLTSGCLNGITRHQVIRQAHSMKMAVKEKDLTPQILRESDAAFLTNSLVGIKPIETRTVDV